MSDPAALRLDRSDRAPPARPAPPPGPARTDKLRAGQLWLVELPASDIPSEPVRRAIADANAVVYDRALAPLVAALVPLGGYAEAAGDSAGADEAALTRCTGLARDGWSVVRLSVSNRERSMVVIEPTAASVAPRLYAVAANGLAG